MTDEEIVLGALDNPGQWDRLPNAKVALSRLVAERDRLREERDVLRLEDEQRRALFARFSEELTAERDRLREALQKIASDVRVPRPPGPRPRWCSPQSPFWNYLDKNEIARAALNKEEK